jgi:hypothetical protein
LKIRIWLDFLILSCFSEQWNPLGAFEYADTCVAQVVQRADFVSCRPRRRVLIANSPAKGIFRMIGATASVSVDRQPLQSCQQHAGLGALFRFGLAEELKNVRIAAPCLRKVQRNQAAGWIFRLVRRA